MALEMKAECERCHEKLAADSPLALICSFECTFCVACAQTRLGGRCPNCGGALAARPPRAEALLARFPASTERVKKDHAACVGA